MEELADLGEVGVDRAAAEEVLLVDVADGEDVDLAVGDVGQGGQDLKDHAQLSRLSVQMPQEACFDSR